MTNIGGDEVIHAFGDQGALSRGALAALEQWCESCVAHNAYEYAGDAIQAFTQTRGMTPARLAASQGTVKVLVMGDSKSEGVGATTVAQRWQNVLTDRLRAVWGGGADTSAVSYVPVFYAHPWIQSLSTISGTENTDYFKVDYEGGPGAREVMLQNSNAKVTFVSQKARYITVHYTEHYFSYGKFAVRINGTVKATIDTVNTAGTVAAKELAIDMGSVQDCVVVLEWVSGSPRFNGVEFETAKNGVKVYDFAHSGWRADLYAYGKMDSGSDSAARQVLLFRQEIANFEPNLIVIALGANDMSGNWGTPITAAEWKQSLTVLLEHCMASAPKAGVVILHGAMRLEDAKPTKPEDYPGKLREFELAAREAAQTHPMATVIYESSLWQPRSTDPQDPLGWLSDTVHPSNLGHSAIGNYVASKVIG